jgi:hypothetical protein
MSAPDESIPERTIAAMPQSMPGVLVGGTEPLQRIAVAGGGSGHQCGAVAHHPMDGRINIIVEL